MTKKKKFWRLCPFKKGDVLKVSKDISAKEALFSKSEILTFINAGISQYSGMTAYEFKSESGEYKVFDMLDSDGIEKLTSLFNTTDEKPEKPKSQKSFRLLTVLIVVALIGVGLKITYQLSYVIDFINKETLYAVGACILGALAFLIKFKK
jgi:hypothetical protein